MRVPGGVAAQPGGQRAHQRTIGHVERQHVERGIVSGRRQPSGEQAVRAVVAPAGRIVHHGEREIAGDVDPAQRVVEFDAIEHQQPAAPANDIVQMQIAMTRAHETVRVTLGQPRRDARQLGFAPCAQRGLGRPRGVERVEQRPALGGDRGGAAETRARRTAGRMQMVVREARRQRVGVREAVVVPRAARGQHRVRLETPHAHHVFQRVVARAPLPPARAQRAADRAGERAAPALRDERPHVQVQRIGQRAVERAFGQRATSALRAMRDVEEAELHRLDDLVRIASREIHDRQVRLDPPDLAGGMRIGGRAAQRAIDAPRVAARFAASQREGNASRIGHGMVGFGAALAHGERAWSGRRASASCVPASRIRPDFAAPPLDLHQARACGRSRQATRDRSSRRCAGDA